MNDSNRREMLEEMSDDMVTMSASLETGRGEVGAAVGESLRRSLKDRRVLMVAAEPAVGDKVESTLLGAGVPVQRVTSSTAIRTEIEDGIARLRRGEVVLVDADAFNAMYADQSATMRDTAGAIMAIIADTRLGSVDDHVLMVTHEEALRSALVTVNKLMDRMVEADLVKQMGGVDAIPPMVRRFMNWLPQTAERERDRAVVIAGAARDAAAFAAAASIRGSTVVVDPARIDTLDFEAGPLGDCDGYKTDLTRYVYDETGEMTASQHERLGRLLDEDAIGMRPGDELMDSLFGGDALERRSRYTCVLRDDLSLGRIAGKVMMAGLIEREGFDHRAENDAWNRRQGRGSRGDRRANRGGKGRR